MRSCSAKRLAGKTVSICSDAPVENGPSSKEEEEEMSACAEDDVRIMAATVVDHVVKMASTKAAQSSAQYGEAGAAHQEARRDKMLQRLPTIQIDSVPSLPPSPTEWSPIEEADVQIEFDAAVQVTSVDEVKSFVTTYIHDLLSKAMMVAEKKLQFARVPEEINDQEEEETELLPPPPPPVEERESSSSSDEDEDEDDDSEIREAAARIVEDVLAKACEVAQNRMDSKHTFHDLPMIQIDTVPSPTPSSSSELEDEIEKSASHSEVHRPAARRLTEGMADLVSFDSAPEDVRELAANFIKDLVARAIALAEEKMVPTVPFNFADVDLMKGNGPWYIRAREALVRLLRTACFCTPRRHDT